MKRRIPWFMFLTLIMVSCSQGDVSEQHNITALKPSMHVNVEFVSEPQTNILQYDTAWRWNAPQIAVGDLTGDHYPEISFVAGAWVPSQRAAESEGVYYSHPVTFSWNGQTFELLKADWVGISSYVSQVSVYRSQSIPIALRITDIDQDGANELIVGTGAMEFKGAVYIFQWDGGRFVAEYSDYCLGAVSRIDEVNDGTEVVLSVSGRPTGASPYDREMCPEVIQGTAEPTTGLYSLRATQPNAYESHLLTLNNYLSTALVGNSEYLSSTYFVRVQSPGSNELVDWSTRQVWHYADEQLSAGTLPLEIERPLVQMKTADLDGDQISEIVVLAAKEWRDYVDLADEDLLLWLVFQQENNAYQLVYEGEVDFSSSRYSTKLFAVGDADNDGTDELLASNGELYTWLDDHLELQVNLSEAMGEEFCKGLESIYIGTVHNDGKNRIVFTARDASATEFCPDQSYPRLYVVSLN